MKSYQVQLASGVGVLPNRAAKLTLVPEGVCALEDSVCQFCALPVSRIRDVKTPLAA